MCVQNKCDSRVIWCNMDECCHKHLEFNTHFFFFGSQIIYLVIPSITALIAFPVPRITGPKEIWGRRCLIWVIFQDTVHHGAGSHESGSLRQLTMLTTQLGGSNYSVQHQTQQGMILPTSLFLLPQLTQSRQSFTCRIAGLYKCYLCGTGVHFGRYGTILLGLIF